MEKKLVRILLLVALVFLAIFPAISTRAEEEEDNPLLSRYTEDWTPKQADEWRKILPQLQAINASDTSLSEQCVARWNILWPLAKAGNLKARNSLFMNLIFSFVRIPDYPSDILSMNRLGVTLFMHSRGAPRAYSNLDHLDPRGLGLSYSSFSALTQNEPVMTCMARGERQECTRLAVQQKLIPSFDGLAAEIDGYLQNGKTFQCPTVDMYGR